MDDLKNFLGYCESWADAIDDHHNAEGLRSHPGLLPHNYFAID